MFDKLEKVQQRFEELSNLLSAEEVLKDPQLLKKHSKERKDLAEIVQVFVEYKKTTSELEGAKQIWQSSNDSELSSLAKLEVEELEQKKQSLEQELKVLLLPKDPYDEKNVILEIRAGAGGDEASIFAGDLFRMYSRYSDNRGWKVEILSTSAGSTGGYKEIIGMISGVGAYSRLKFESGVHRVQRVPVTEAQGRIHTSTITVAVLPEAEDVEVQIAEKDLRIDVYRSGGPGGQSVNTTDSAVRITHIPTGLVVAMQDEKSQLKNKAKALKVLKARLLEREQAAKEAERRETRRSQVGTGDRSEKIRTYNYPQSRISDHRINFTSHALDIILNGDLDQLIDPLTAHYQAEALNSTNE